MVELRPVSPICEHDSSFHEHTQHIILGQVAVTNCMITEHKVAGIIAKDSFLMVDYDKMMMRTNGRFAILIPEESMKEMVVLYRDP